MMCGDSGDKTLEAALDIALVSKRRAAATPQPGPCIKPIQALGT
jgi:hypothetical protein